MSHVLALAGRSIIAMVAPGEPLDQAPLTGFSKQLSDPRSGLPAFRLPLTWTNLVQLVNTLHGAYVTPELAAWAADEVGRRARESHLDVEVPTLYGPDGTPQPLPDGLSPFPWQNAAARRFSRVGKALLSDEPGTGKTISALMSIASRTDTLPALIVAPAGVISSWLEMATNWFPDWHVNAYRGPRRQLGGDIVLTSYDLVIRDVDKLKEYGFQGMVLDEHHLLKNRGAKRTEAVNKLSKTVPHTIAMSGTPISHSPDDIFSTLRILDQESWPARDRWVDRYLETYPGEYKPIIGGFRQDRRPEFDLAMSGVWRQVTKTEALPFLPPKVYSVREVEMPAKWRKAYKAMAASMSADLPTGSAVDVMHALTQLQVLTAMTTGPCRVEYTPNKNPDKADHVKVILEEGSWKVTELLAILEERPQSSVLVFSPSRQLIDLATEAVRKVLGDDKVVQIVGGQTPKVRDAAKDAFQAGEATVCLATLQAGGVGLTLTAADTVVFLGRSFNMVDTLQAEDRPHRPGTVHKTLDIIDVVTTRSVDQRVWAVLRERNMSMADFLTGAEAFKQLLQP